MSETNRGKNPKNALGQFTTPEREETTLEAREAKLALAREEFPEEVFESLAALRKLQSSVRSLEEWTKKGRKATPAELALADALHEDYMCTGHSTRSGLPCQRRKRKGMLVCYTHGGNIPQVVKAAKRRYLEAMDPTITRIIQLRDQEDHLPTAMRAAEHIIDRSLGPVETKEKSGNSGPVINIGFAVKTDKPTEAVIEGEVIEREE